MNDPIVEAIHDLTRVIIAVNGDFKSKAETIRQLDALSIPTGRIAAILAMDPRDVSSSLAKARKKKERENAGSAARGDDV